jgi:pentatricopeptide repeat protein
MKTYRFVSKTHHDVIADSLEEAVKAFNEMKQEGLLPEVDVVSRIEVRNAEGAYVPVDRPLRAGDLDKKRGERAHLSA